MTNKAPTIARPLRGLSALRTFPFCAYIRAEGNGRGGCPLAGGTAHGAAGAQLSAAPLGNHGDIQPSRSTTA